MRRRRLHFTERVTYDNVSYKVNMLTYFESVGSRTLELSSKLSAQASSEHAQKCVGWKACFS